MKHKITVYTYRIIWDAEDDRSEVVTHYYSNDAEHWYRVESTDARKLGNLLRTAANLSVSYVRATPLDLNCPLIELDVAFDLLTKSVLRK